MKQAKSIGTDFAIQGINKLEHTAINKGLSPELIHNVSSVVKEGAHKAFIRVGSLADGKVNNLTSHINARIGDSDNSDIDEPQITRPAVIRPHVKRLNNAANVRGSKIQSFQRRKRKLSSYPYHSSKRVKFSSNLQNNIEQS